MRCMSCYVLNRLDNTLAETWNSDVCRRNKTLHLPLISGYRRYAEGMRDLVAEYEIVKIFSNWVVLMGHITLPLATLAISEKTLTYKAFIKYLLDNKFYFQFDLSKMYLKHVIALSGLPFQNVSELNLIKNPICFAAKMYSTKCVPLSNL